MLGCSNLTAADYTWSTGPKAGSRPAGTEPVCRHYLMILRAETSLGGECFGRNERGVVPARTTTFRPTHQLNPHRLKTRPTPAPEKIQTLA